MSLPEGTWEQRGPAAAGAPIIIFVTPFEPQAEARPVITIPWSGDLSEMRAVAEMILSAAARQAPPSQPPREDE